MQFTIRAFLYSYISLTFVVMEENKKKCFDAEILNISLSIVSSKVTFKRILNLCFVESKYNVQNLKN